MQCKVLFCNAMIMGGDKTNDFDDEKAQSTKYAGPKCPMITGNGKMMITCTWINH